MGRRSICKFNWNDENVQKSLNDYVEGRIPTQIKLRQIISAQLQQEISEQTMHAYLKRNKRIPEKNSNFGKRKRSESKSPSPPKRILVETNNEEESDEKTPLSTKNSSPNKSKTNEVDNDDGNLIVSTHLRESSANLMNSKKNLGAQKLRNFLQNVFNAEHSNPIFHSSGDSSFSKYLTIGSSSLSLVQMKSNSREIFLPQNKESEKISAGNQQINWNDTVVKYFERQNNLKREFQRESIKLRMEFQQKSMQLKSELRQDLMQHLERDFSEDSLRLYLKK